MHGLAVHIYFLCILEYTSALVASWRAGKRTWFDFLHNWQVRLREKTKQKTNQTRKRSHTPINSLNRSQRGRGGIPPTSTAPVPSPLLRTSQPLVAQMVHCPSPISVNWIIFGVHMPGGGGGSFKRYHIVKSGPAELLLLQIWYPVSTIPNPVCWKTLKARKKEKRLA